MGDPVINLTFWALLGRSAVQQFPSAMSGVIRCGAFRPQGRPLFAYSKSDQKWCCAANDVNVPCVDLGPSSAVREVSAGVKEVWLRKDRQHATKAGLGPIAP